MSQNQKLTKVIAGRTINGTSNSNNLLTVHFSDGSAMTVKTAGSSNSASTGGKIAAVRQQDTTLHLDFEGGGAMTVATAEPTSCVMVRDKSNALEYAD